MPSQIGFIRATCCNPDPCDLPCWCSCCYCTGGSCGGSCGGTCAGTCPLKTCSSGSCGTCYAPAYDISWVYSVSCRDGNCSLPTAAFCGQLMGVYDASTFVTINYVLVTDCGPWDWCSSGVFGELTRGGWYALGHSSMGGTDSAIASW